MDSQDHLKIPVFLFSILLFFQFITGLLLFNHHYGWSQETIGQFYHLTESSLQPMSFVTYLKTAFPHLAAMGLLSFVIFHFFSFIDWPSAKARMSLGVSLAVFTLLDILSGLIVIQLGANFYWVKLMSFLGFQISFLGSAIVIFLSLTSELQFQSPTKE